MKNIIAGFLLICVSCSKPQLKHFENARFAGLDTALADQQKQINNLRYHAEKQDSIIKILALHAYHADSIAEQKKFKSDRAERRGRFLGGLLRSLILGL